MLERLTYIRRNLSRTQPILGRLASFIEVSLADDLHCAVETGINTLRFAPDYAQQAANEALLVWLAHASLHMALLHFDPPAGQPEVWSRACDAKVNALLVMLNLTAPPDGLEQHRWWNEAASERGTAAQQRMGGAVSDDSASATLRQGQAQQWRLRVRQALGEALGAGEAEGVLIRELLGKGQVASGHDWRVQLAAFLQRWHRAEAHYGRASRRAVPPFLIPALRPAALHLVVAVDTSASIGSLQLQQFWSEIQSLAGQVTMRMTLLAADTQLAEGAPWVFAPGEVPQWPNPHGQGGTDFRPVFAWLAESDTSFDAVIYFTDGKGDYPAERLNVPVLWVLAGEGGDIRNPPFGEVVYL